VVKWVSYDIRMSMSEYAPANPSPLTYLLKCTTRNCLWESHFDCCL